ncbi:hybrid sensor histidine kinase/response regulator [Spirulina subsalsa FACHB-351]|uniref:histidine kinase n=1 Tax=Spirulina subsalsa FACHB-351 TaxID=234711 RepID=A0ABT3L7H2_9CYAN|nr:hybrid sensor histidine kinase/response regulator [Spirulina subsalsa]MCW6036910.1 hybrid sensor histidine kinase/response regulator [Spirulina subsalsa FACHB-351]
MPASSLNILLIEDNLAEARLLRELLNDSHSVSCRLVHVKRLKEALIKLGDTTFDVILLDLTLPDSNGLLSLSPLAVCAPSVPIVVLTNTNDSELAREAMRRGAQDYLVKRQVNNTETLVRALIYAVERKQALESLRESHEALENQIEEKVAELLQAQQQNQLKSEFVSMLSHDFRNPLNTILLSAGLLQDNQDRLTEDKKIRLFQQIRLASKSMAQLLDEVLLIGKAEMDQLPCELSPLSLESFCRGLVEELEGSMVEGKRVCFSWQGGYSEGLWDKRLLRHILENLLSNALKYSPEETIVEFEVEVGEESVLFEVRDRGIGITWEDQKKLFQPFHRGRNVGHITGTGLGLAIAKHCAQAHGGMIRVESQVGVGTTFRVELPLVVDDLHGNATASELHS